MNGSLVRRGRKPIRVARGAALPRRCVSRLRSPERVRAAQPGRRTRRVEGRAAFLNRATFLNRVAAWSSNSGGGRALDVNLPAFSLQPDPTNRRGSSVIGRELHLGECRSFPQQAGGGRRTGRPTDTGVSAQARRGADVGRRRKPMDVTLPMTPPRFTHAGSSRSPCPWPTRRRVCRGSGSCASAGVRSPPPGSRRPHL